MREYTCVNRETDLAHAKLHIYVDSSNPPEHPKRRRMLSKQTRIARA
jgi:hypothetical protein